ncbi:MAG: phosphoribosylformylglycinamidine synthase subunit PurS [Deltaproteobacteria bacterium]|nr:phosphoribosylformylglycinamidine synthase subunit PurS [Deltaproteobacteria bacterium]
MAHRVEVAMKGHLRDARGEGVAREVREFLHRSVEEVRTLDVYTVDLGLGADEVERGAKEALSDPIVQDAAVGLPLALRSHPAFHWAVEVGFLPGVTDNVGRTAKEALEMLLGRAFPHEAQVYTAVQYLLRGEDLTREGAEAIAVGLLANPLIERWEILSREEFGARGGFPARVPRVREGEVPSVEAVDLEVTDEELLRLSKERLLALSLEEMEVIRHHYLDEAVRARRRELGLPDAPTDVELECLAQTWSEHCKHKIFNATIHYDDGAGNTRTVESLFKTYVVGATERIRKGLGDRDFCLSVFKDNAGVIAFDDQWSLCFKVETHNSPSALDPYGGALTGIVGVNRDPMGTGMGARLVFNVDTFCFADPFFEGELPPRLLHPRRIYEGVVRGVEHGGNKSGIPTINGGVVFDDRFLGKPLVFCGTAGVLPRTLHGRPSHEKRALPGDLIVMAGGRVGKDGIHGATFSSEELHEGSPATAVQLGDPITQKRLYDFLLVARDRGLYRSITDNGAGGLSSSIGEMAEQAGGAELHLDRTPLKYPGLAPWEILVSESQERMSFAVPPEAIDEFLALAEERKVEACVLGTFTADEVFHCRYRGATVAWLPMAFLHGGLPAMELSARWEKPVHEEPSFACPDDVTADLFGVLGRLNVCSKESIVRRYDHEVQGGSVVKPFVGLANDGPSDAAVVRPILESFAGVVTASGICPRYSDIDAYWMMAAALDEAVRNALCVGGSLEYLAGLDNFCWCDPVQSERTPDGEYKLAQLVRANEALYDISVAYGVPLISGKDSMKNDYHIGGTKISIPPTVLFSVIGRVDDVRRCVTMDAKRAGDAVYVLGTTRRELGGSEYWAAKGFVGNDVPRVFPEESLPLYRSLERAIHSGLVASCHDCSDGGLAVALAETAFAGGLGLRADLSRVPAHGIARDDELLFSESQSRFVVTVRPELAEAFEAELAGRAFGRIGEVTAEPRLVLRGLEGGDAVRAGLNELKAAWQLPLRNV